MRLNLVAWFRLVMLVIKELSLRCGILGVVEAFKRINIALEEYMRELERIDIEAFKQEVQRSEGIIVLLDKARSIEELNIALNDIFEREGYKKPWVGDFDEFMSNKNNTLVFE